MPETVPCRAGCRLATRRGWCGGDRPALERLRVEGQVSVDVSDPVVGIMIAGQDIEAVRNSGLGEPGVEHFDVWPPRVILPDVERDRQARRALAVDDHPERAGGAP